MMLSMAGSAALVAAVVVCALNDILWRRIPNALTVSALIVALGLRAGLGTGALLYGLAGAAVAVLVTLPLFAMRGIGGGDAKLLIVVGAFLGPTTFVVAVLATALAGGAMSLVAAAHRGVLLPVLFNTRDLMKWVFTLGRRGERTSLVSPGAVSVPYGVAIAMGSIFALFYGGGL